MPTKITYADKVSIGYEERLKTILDVEGVKKIYFCEPGLWKLLEDVLHHKKGVSRERGGHVS